MNYLALVNRVRRECGAASSDLQTLQGVLVLDDTRFVGWVDEGWRAVQTHRPDWNWMRAPFSFTTTAGQFSYTPAQAGIANFGNWKRDSYRAYTTGQNFADEQLAPYMDYSTWRNVYQYANQRFVQGRPVAISEDPQKNLLIGPVPDQSYTVLGEYYRAPTDLVLDTDAPDMPDRFHMLVVWHAAEAYGLYESAPEVVQRAQAEMKKLYRRLDADQIPTLIHGAPLA